MRLGPYAFISPEVSKPFFELAIRRFEILPSHPALGNVLLYFGLFSLFFLWYQAWRGKSFWAGFYMPLLSFALSLPLILMGGWFRPALGVVLIVLGGWGIWKQISSANTAMRPPSRTGP